MAFSSGEFITDYLNKIVFVGGKKN